MRKHLLFSVMLSLCAMGGMMVYSTPVMATVAQSPTIKAVSYTHLRAHETGRNLVCRLLLEKKKNKEQNRQQ